MKIKTSLIHSVYLVGVALLVLVAQGLPLWLLSVIIVMALGAPLVREFRKNTDLDERQVYISHFSSHIAYYVFLALLLFVILRSYLKSGINPDPEWYMLLIIPLVVKFLLSLFKNYGAVRASSWVAYFFGTVWLLFVLFSHGISFGALMEALPFILIILLGWAATKYPLWAGIGFLLLAVALLVFFGAWWRLGVYVRLLMYALIPLPLVVSGLALVLNKVEEEAL